ncbi:hypothetical protein [Halomonas denitrificans]|nr:hypothetical protein [Halomonas denitrificans]
MNRLDALRARASASTRQQAADRLPARPDQALRQVQRALELRIRELPRDDRGPVACAPGCAFCCHLRVMATAVEVFAFLDYLRDTLSAAEFGALGERARSTAARLSALPAERLLAVNLPCPALVDGRCSGYAGRPLNCRAYHSLSVEACRESFDHPEDLHRGHPQLAPLARVHGGAQAGLIDALASHGLDARQYELASALAEALDEPEATRARLAAGEPVFRRARTID